jgi:hypothetical protein
MPQQFWEEAMKGNPALTDEGRAQVLAPLADYALFGVMRAKVAARESRHPAQGRAAEEPEAEVNGKAVEPLAPESIAPGADAAVDTQARDDGHGGGAAGHGVRGVPAKADGKLLIDALQTGSVQVSLYDQTCRFRTPLGSLLPVKVDAKTGRNSRQLFVQSLHRRKLNLR